jgi:hypothetical protein
MHPDDLLAAIGSLDGIWLSEVDPADWPMASLLLPARSDWLAIRVADRDGLALEYMLFSTRRLAGWTSKRLRGEAAVEEVRAWLRGRRRHDWQASRRWDRLLAGAEPAAAAGGVSR